MRIWLAVLIFLGILVIWSDGRKRRRANEIRIINRSNRNLKLRCQSLRMDLSDQFIDADEEFHFNFYDIDPGIHLLLFP